MKNKKRLFTTITEKITTKRVIAGALVCALFLSALPGDFFSARIAKAEGELDPANDVSASSDLTIYDDEYGFTVNTTDGQSIVLQKEGNTYQWPAGLSITQVQSISGQIAFDIAAGSTSILPGKYFKVKFPEVFSFDNNYSVAQECLIDDEGTPAKLGEYVINNKEFVFTFTNEDLGKPTTSFEKTQVTFSASIDTEVLKNSETNSFSLAGSGGGNSIYIPPMPTTISALSESVEVSDKNELYWTVTLGKDEEIGADISGGKVTIGFEKNQEYQNKAYFNDAAKTGINFVLSGEDEIYNYYTAYLPEGTVLSSDTRNITFLCYPTTAVMSPTTKNDAKVVFNSKSEFLKADAAEGESPYTANAQCELKRTSVTKTGEMLDGNRMKWTLTFNANEANVFAATLTDSMVEGLTFDTSYGVEIAYDGGEVTLKEAGTTYDVGDAKVVYNVTDNNAKGGQDFAIDFSDVFKKAYTISFATIVSDTAFAGDSEIRNALDVAVRYPTGGGSGNPVDYGVPEAGFQVLNGFIDIKKTSTTEEVETSGYLGWKVLPTTKMENTGYSSADVIITLGADGAQEFDKSSLKITYDGSDLESTKYETDYTTENVLKITFTDASLDLNKVQITFNSKAKTYFASAAKKDYTAFADLTLHAEQDYSATQDKAFYSDIQNKMISETVASSYNDSANELLFTFDIDVNHKKLSLTDVHVTDNIAGILHFTSVNDDATYDLTVDEGAIPAEYVEVKKIIATVGEDVTTYAKDDGTLAPVLKNGTDIDVALGALNHTKGNVQIVVGLTAEGKETLNVGGALSKKVIFAKNSSTVTSIETSAFSTAEIVSSKNNQIAVNKIAVKDGTQDTSVVTWGIDINSLGADLGSSANIVDKIPAGLSLNKDSVKLYKVSHSGIGTSISTDYKNGASANAVLVNASDYRTTIKKNRDNTTTLTVYLPKNDNHASYGLVYETIITGAVGAYTNELTMTVSTGSEIAMKKVNVGAFSSGGVSRFALLTMKKTDAISGKAVVGAKYGIFESEADAAAAVQTKDETKAYDVGYTNTSGEITFLVKAAKKSATNYYVCELEVPAYADENGVKYDNDGLYQLDKTVYPIKDVFSGVYSIGADTTNGFKSTKAFTDQREVSAAKTGTVTLTNIFKDEGEAGKYSEFQLFVCPTGASSNKDIPVVLKQTTDGENGSYTFVKYEDKASATASYTEIGTVSESFDDKESRSTVTVTGLPWGTYCLKQKKTVDGYYSEKPSATFTLEQDELGNVTVKDGSETTITDIKTTFTVTDTVEDKAVDSVGLEYVLKDVTANKSWTITGAELTAEGGWKRVGELVAGHKFVLTQTKIPNGYKPNTETAKKTVASFSGKHTINLTEKKIVANVKLQDQDGKTVEGATISIEPVDTAVLNATVEPANGLNLDKKINRNSTYKLRVTFADTNKNQYLIPTDGDYALLKVSSTGVISSEDSKTDSLVKAVTEGTTTTLTVYKAYGNVVIREYSEDDTTHKDLITGGKFTLYNADTDTVISGYESITDDGDNETLDIAKLPVGHYYLLQTDAPNSYSVTDEGKAHKHAFTIDNSLPNNQTKYVEVTYNHPIPGTINASKAKTDKNPVEGAQYTLYRLDARGEKVEVSTQTTDANGKITFSNLLWDSYYIVETKAPKGYRLDTTTHGPYTIDADHQVIDVPAFTDESTEVTISTVGIDVRDGKEEDDASVTKEPLNTGLLDARLKYEVKGIFAGADGEETRTFTDDDKDGLITVTNEFVVGNKYTFTQKDVKKPYNAVVPFEVTITDALATAGGSEKIDVTNHMNRVAFELVNEEGENLGDGKFVLRDADQNVVMDNLVSEESGFLNDGRVELLGLEPGVYTLEETKAPSPTMVDTYVLDKSGVKFELLANNTVKILSVNNDSVNQTKEASEKNKTKVEAILGTSGSLKKKDEAVITYVNALTRLYFNVEVLYNETCNEDSAATADLKGIYYNICSDKLCVFNPVTDESGKIVILGLPEDDYTVEMLNATGNNIMKNDETYTAKVSGTSFEGLRDSNGNIKKQTTRKIGDGKELTVSVLTVDIYREDLVLTKTDQEDKDTLLEGSVYGLYRKSDFDVSDAVNYDESSDQLSKSADEWTDLVTTATTDENGKITFEGVDVGVEYRIQEISEPDGYQVSKDPVFVRFVRDDKGEAVLKSLDDGNGTANVAADGTVTWFEPRLKVAIKYVDEEDDSCIEGGTFEVVETDSRSEKHAWTTGTDWELISGKLTGGMSYTVVQTAVPQGYEPSGDTVFVAEKRYVSATDENKPQEIIIKARRKSAETPSGETPSGETPSGETPSDETPTGETPTGETPTGETPTGGSSDGTPTGGTPIDGGTPQPGTAPSDAPNPGETDEKSPKTGDFLDFLYRFF